jgi:hemerythrin-like domain-containing protein
MPHIAQDFQGAAMISFPKEVAAPNFDDPLEMLHACHGRILGQCDTLRRLAIHLNDSGYDQQAQQAAQNILRFFDSAGQFHHQDEEEDLFPAMRIFAAPDESKLQDLFDRLLHDHAGMLVTWGALRPVLLQLSQGSRVPLASPLTENFINRYAKHIAFEENELLPLAARLLDSQQKLKLGKHMAERRGATFISNN